MAAVDFRLRALLAGASVVALGALCSATGGSAWAAEKDPHDKGGPVVFLNRHWGPTDCWVAVKGVKDDGNDYEEMIIRGSCDGTLWMPKLKLNSPLKIVVHSSAPSDFQIALEAYVKQARDESKSEVDNDTAICFLAKGSGKVTYTNMSAKGGDCNGS